MTTADLEAVLAIEGRAQSNPWGRASFEECLANSRQCMVATTIEGHFQGYAVMMISGHEAELLTLAVAPDSRRAGVARQLLDGLLELCRDSGVEEVFLEVRDGNVAAIALYLDLDFCDVGQRSDYYGSLSGQRESARVMKLDLK
jgi:ribosomal-protein-alanine N-acetyltransferase